MTSWAERWGPWALVTGAAMGLGRAYAFELARRGLSLCLVDCAEAELAATSGELRRLAEVESVTLDLGATDAAARLDDALEGVELGLAVHCAAVCPIGPFVDLPIGDHARTVAVNVSGSLAVAHVAGRRLVERGRGGLVLVSSGSALSGSPLVANYAATKGYIATLALSLAAELGPQGIDVLAVCPGMIRTAATERHPPRLDRAPWVRMIDAERVARESLDDLGARLVSIPGGLGEKVGLTMMSRILPRRLALSVIRRTMLRLYG